MVTKFPLLRPAIAMAAGIFIASNAPVLWQGGFALTVLLAGGAVVFSKYREALTIGFWIFLGASLFSFRYDIREGTDLRAIFSGEPELVRVAGVLKVDPQRRVLERDGETRYRTTASVSVRQIQRGGEWTRASGDVAISTTGFVPEDFVAGTTVEIFGVLSRPQGPLAPGLFDFEEYLKWQRMFFVLRADTTNDWRLVAQAEGWSAAALYRTFNDWARRTLARGIPQDENTRLIWAMVLGWKPGLTNEISEPFMRTGTLHVFAISGMHIAMIAAMLVGALRLFGLSRNWAGGIAIPIIWFYAGATGWQASAIRSTIMCSVIIFGWLLKRPNNLLNSLATSAVLILLWQPEQLFQTGFQLSFLLLFTFAVWPGLSPNTPWPDPSFYLGYTQPEEFERKPADNRWTRGMAHVYQWLTGRDPLLPAELRPRWRRFFDGVIMSLLGALNVSIASLVGSLPVIANYFNLISFNSVIANLLIVPASGLSLGLSMCSLVVGWIPFIPEMLNWLSWRTMGFMVWFCRGLEGLSWSYEYVQAPGALVVIIYYVVFAGVRIGYFRAAAVGGLILVAIPIFREVNTTSVTLLPGSGVIFVDEPWSKNDVLVDCGRDHEMATLVQPFLRSRGVDRLNAVVLTHGDIAHVEGYTRLKREFDPRITYTSGAKSRSPKYREILRGLEASEGKWRMVAAGDEVCGWRVLHPEGEQDFSKADDEAIVLGKEIGGRKVTLLSELGKLGQQALVARGGKLECDVVFAGAPTDGDMLGAELLERLRAEIIVVAGNDPRAQRAAKELRTRATNVISSFDQRAVTLTRRGATVRVETMAGTRMDVR